MTDVVYRFTSVICPYLTDAEFIINTWHIMLKPMRVVRNNFIYTWKQTCPNVY
jgi:hypothetical protein